MVRVGRGRGGYRTGGILGDEWRAAIDTAAVALFHGFDPLRFIDLVGVDRLVMDRVLQRAEDQWTRRQRNTAQAIGYYVGKALSGK